MQWRWIFAKKKGRISKKIESLFQNITWYPSKGGSPNWLENDNLLYKMIEEEHQHATHVVPWWWLCEVRVESPPRNYKDYIYKRVYILHKKKRPSPNQIKNSSVRFTIICLPKHFPPSPKAASQNNSSLPPNQIKNGSVCFTAICLPKHFPPYP